MPIKSARTVEDLIEFLRLLASDGAYMSQRQLAKKMKVSPATIYRLFRECRDDYKMVIEKTSEKYRIRGWGILNPYAIVDEKFIPDVKRRKE